LPSNPSVIEKLKIATDESLNIEVALGTFEKMATPTSSLNFLAFRIGPFTPRGLSRKSSTSQGKSLFMQCVEK